MATSYQIYVKDAIDIQMADKVNKVTALPEGKSATDTVTFQDLIDMGIIVIQQ